MDAIRTVVVVSGETPDRRKYPSGLLKPSVGLTFVRRLLAKLPAACGRYEFGVTKRGHPASEWFMNRGKPVETGPVNWGRMSMTEAHR